MGFDHAAGGSRDAAIVRRLVVGITGSTGSILGIRLLEALGGLGVETHLVLSEWAERTIRIETSYTVAEVLNLASTHYQNGNQAAPISSGSFSVDGMIIIPCSMKTLGGAGARPIGYRQ